MREVLNRLCSLISIFKHAMRPEDSKSTRLSKKLILVAYMVGIITSLRELSGSAGKGEPKVRGGITLVAAAGCMIDMLVNKRINYSAAEMYMYWVSIRMILIDMTFIVLYESRVWPAFIVFIDICYFINLPYRTVRNILTICTCWLTLTVFETYLRFGLYDLPNLPPQEDRHQAVNCTNLPCSKTFVASAIDGPIFQLIIIFLDFYFTRTFANGLHKEHEKMNAAISATERIASALSHFDLTSAEAILNTATLTPPLDTAFRSILTNLEMYRPYLPDALFAHLHTEHALHSDSGIPGLATGNATIVFTDIQASTATWEACSSAMREALEVHNDVIRDCIAAHGGYEVKTIGDAFMVAFDCARSAVAFGLLVQEKLVYAPWPAALLELEHCSCTEDGPWCGLRVRIGVHCGEVDVKLNSVTGRYDYFGNTVNKAARMEGVCVGGAVAITDEVLDEAGDMDMFVIDMGPVELKGVQGSMHAFLLLPQTLVGRRPHMENALLARGRRGASSLSTERSISIGSRSSNMSSVAAQIFAQRDRLTYVQSATVCVSEVILRTYDTEEVSECVNRAIDRVVSVTERTHGTIVSLQGSRVAVCWNGPKVCVTHVENSLAFVRMVGVGWETEDHGMHVGVGTGSVVCGAVGGRRQKFVAVLGVCVGVGSTLCTDAVKDSVLCYYAAGTVPSQLEGLGLVAVEKGYHTVPDGTQIHVIQVRLDEAQTDVQGYG